MPSRARVRASARDLEALGHQQQVRPLGVVAGADVGCGLRIERLQLQRAAALRPQYDRHYRKRRALFAIVRLDHRYERLAA